MRTLLLYVLAFCSGFAALVYQVAWSRMLSLAFGSTTLAVSAVVAGFMGGMGIGAWLYYRVGERVRVPLRAYASLELGIALTTALFTLLYLPLPEWFAAAAGHLRSGLALDAFRVATAFALLLVPASLMGATYPALCQALLHSVEEVEGRLGWIYGLNTLGAAVGAFAAGFAMIEALGSRGSVTAANAINLTVGGIALLMAARGDAGATAAVAPDESLTSDLPYWLTGLVLFGSGLATIGYEIVWFRALHYVMGVGTYVLSAALVIFLLGLGFGGLLYRLAVRRGRPEWNLGWCQLMIALFAVFAIGAEQLMLVTPYFFDQFTGFSKTVLESSWQTRIAKSFGLALVIMLPATLWMGLSFPLASRLFLGSVRDLTSRVGLAYLLSNLGAISGALLAAMWILPTVGTVGGTRLLVGLNVVLGVMVLIRASGIRRRAVAAGLVAVVVLFGSLLPDRLAFRSWKLEDSENMNIRFENESHLGTVQVIERRDDEEARALVIDGVSIATTQHWNPNLYNKQLVLAHLPMMLDRSIRHTLNLGVASGSTLDALSRYDWVESLDAVEINPSVVRASAYFPDSAVYEDPRTELFVEDAVHYLVQTDRLYDLIVSDAKQDVRFGGNAKVLSHELYEYSKARMSECGLFVQFLPVLNGSLESLKLILRTFNEVFPEVGLFMESPYYLITVGSRCPLDGREVPSDEDIARIGLADDIAPIVPHPNRLRALWLAQGSELVDAIGPGPLNSWDRLPFEFISYRQPAPHPATVAEILAFLLAPRKDDRLGSTAFGADPLFEPALEIMLAYQDWFSLDYDAARSRIERVVAENPRLPLARRAQRDIRNVLRSPERK